MINRFLARFELFSLRHLPQFSISIRSRRNHRLREDRDFLDLMAELQQKSLIIQSLSEAYNLYRLCAQTRRVKGDIAELGVYKGGTARLLCQVKQNRELHLFDTFDAYGGMPAVRAGVDLHKPGDFKEAQITEVKKLLSGFEGIRFYPGFFPETTQGVKNRSGAFAFVHLDVDIYQSTLDGLQYFYPRLSPGGMLVSHDYQFLPCSGVRKAFDEFFVDKPEPVIELWDTQCLIVKG